MSKIQLMLVLILVIPLHAKEIGGIVLPETPQAGGSNLVLNGAGLRKKLFIKVYAGGLYLTERSSDAKAIVAADQAMIPRMHFIYNGVSAKKLIDAWNKSFEKGTEGNTSAIQERIDAFNALFTVEAKKGDVYDIVYRPGTGVQVVINGEVAGTIAGVEFKRRFSASG